MRGCLFHREAADPKCVVCDEITKAIDPADLLVLAARWRQDAKLMYLAAKTMEAEHYEMAQVKRAAAQSMLVCADELAEEIGRADETNR